MSEQLKFKVSSALKDIIGRDLITDDFIAVFELVKNAYDAHATRVEITFNKLHTSEGEIIISDNGKGMNYNDIINKWLFVAYSAKKSGVEDDNFDYRDEIYSKRTFAGAKGIGRFSCDRLGKELILETTKKEKNPLTEILITDWGQFEHDSENEFVDINVLHESKESNGRHGTTLKIKDLRSDWSRWKLLQLKDSIAKLINPNDSSSAKEFKVHLIVPDEQENDEKETEERKVVNGEIKNFIFEALELKTTKITSRISEDGEFIVTTLIDGGTLIYEIKEVNKFQLLKNVGTTLFYLNRSAKNTFTRRMGLSSSRYGHVFLYKNDIRIYPYGEPGEDPLKIDVRKAQGFSRFLGTRDLIGKIEIDFESEELKEPSSRGNGLIKTRSYTQLEEFFWEVMVRLERYVVDVQQWGVSIEDDDFSIKNRVSSLLSNLTKSNDIVDFQVANNFEEILEASQADSAESIVKNLDKIASRSKDGILIKEVSKAKNKIKRLNAARAEAEKQAIEESIKAKEATRELEEKISENLFLKSISTGEYKEVIALLHHIGIYAGTVDNNLKGISLRVQNDIPLSKAELIDIVKTIGFETKKILNVVGFATKAKFNLTTEEIEIDLANYFEEYISNIIPTVTDKSLVIKTTNSARLTFKRKVKLIELNIVIDNIVSNAKKANAKNLEVIIEEGKKGGLNVFFKDDGIGIKEGDLSKIFELGYTTTDGSGVGLHHVKDIISRMNAKIVITNNDKSEKGITAMLEFL